MKEETKQILEAVIRTLNLISVNGSANLDRLLASIQALETVLQDSAKGETENGEFNSEND